MLVVSFIALLPLLSIMVTFTKNVFMSLMYAVLLFINATVVLLIMGFEFLALVNMLVYVGALAVLFLFVIMLLEVPTTELNAYHRGISMLAIAGILACRLFISHNSITSVTINTFKPITATHALESISNIAYAFYVTYADILILNSLVLTIALLGALVLAHSSA